MYMLPMIDSIFSSMMTERQSAVDNFQLFCQDSKEEFRHSDNPGEYSHCAHNITHTYMYDIAIQSNFVNYFRSVKL